MSDNEINYNPLVDMYNTLYYTNESLYRSNIFYTKEDYEAVKKKYFMSEVKNEQE